MAQLENNLAALSVRLASVQTGALDKVSTPTLSFPIPFLNAAQNLMHAGATVNDVPSEAIPLAPRRDNERY